MSASHRLPARDPVVYAVKEPRLPDLFSELFILGSHLRGSHDFGSPEALRRRLIEMFHSVEREGRRLDVAEERLRQARYAAAAFLDEMILSSPAPARTTWSAHPLQYEFFGEHIAGVEFFNRLNTIRRALPLDRELLEVYYLCLVFGFEGQYKLQGREKLRELIDSLAREIYPKAGKVPPLSPHGDRPDEWVDIVKRGLPVWVIGVVVLAVVFFSFLVFSFLIGHEADGVAEEIRGWAAVAPEGVPVGVQGGFK